MIFLHHDPLQRTKTAFHMNCLLGGNSHEMQILSLNVSEKIHTKIKMWYAAVVISALKVADGANFDITFLLSENILLPNEIKLPLVCYKMLLRTTQ